MVSEQYTMTPVADVVEQIRKGGMVVLVDDERRENEGDLIFAAEHVTPEKINFLVTQGRGLVCVPMNDQRAHELNLNMMVGEEQNTESHGTSFTVSVDVKAGTTTGISAHDRAATIRALCDRNSRGSDFARPGHIFPLRAREGGVLRRAGHTEATVDLCVMAGLQPVGVLCEVMDEDGTMARLPRLFEFARKHNLPVASIQDLIRYRESREKIVQCTARTTLPTEYGKFDMYLYETTYSKESHLAMVCGQVSGKSDVLVRVHSSCLTGDALGSLRCDCRYQLNMAMKMVQEEGQGVVVYLNQEGRGIGLAPKIKAYALQDKGLDTVQANIELGFADDERDYGVGIQILKDLGLSSVRLLTNNPKKVDAFIYGGYGLEVTEQVPIEQDPNDFNRRYLETKRTQMGHRLKKVGNPEKPEVK